MAKTKYKPEFCKTVEEELAKGFSLSAVCGTLGIHRDTLYVWKKKHPDFADSIKRGVCKGQLFYENVLISNISGKTIKGFDHSKSSQTCTIFALKTRFYRDWGDLSKHQQGTDEIKIEISEDDKQL